MKQLSLCMMLYVVCGLLGLNEIALADSTRRYGCIIDGTDREPTGDRNGRTIVSLQYTCRVADGLLKDAGITGLSVSQWDSEKGRYLASIDMCAPRNCGWSGVGGDRFLCHGGQQGCWHRSFRQDGV